MKIHTTMFYPGYNVGVVRQNAKIESYFTVYKNDTPDDDYFFCRVHESEGLWRYG